MLIQIIDKFTYSVKKCVVKNYGGYLLDYITKLKIFKLSIECLYVF